MHLEADPVTEPVPKTLSETGVLDHLARDAIDGGADRAWPDSGQPGELCLEQTAYASSSSTGTFPVENVRVQSGQ